MGPFDAALLAAAVIATAPILFAALGELVSERAGVLNVGLEGMMLNGAFFAFLGTDLTGSILLGILIGAFSGTCLAALMALLSIDAGADQIVVGIGLNVLAAGVTGYLYSTVFSDGGQVVLATMSDWAVPGLSKLPVVGKAFFDVEPLIYLAYLLIPTVWYLLYRSYWGLAIRAAGELPEAVDAAGINVRRVRWTATLWAGTLAAIGGALLSVGQTGVFTEGMSAGRGFLALAAVIFGKWRLGGVVLASCLFGGAEALQLRLQASDSVPTEVWIAIAMIAAAVLVYLLVRRRRVGPGVGIGAAVLIAGGGALALVAPTLSLPSQLWLAFPYVLTLLALAGFVGRVRLPAALAEPYHRADADAN